MNKRVKSLIFLFVTAIIWGFAFPFQDIAADKLLNFSFNGTRFLLGALSLVPIIFIFERGKTEGKKLTRTLVCGIIVGGVLFLASCFQQWGIMILSGAGAPDASGTAGFITGLYSVFVAICSVLFFGKRLSVGTVLGTVSAVAGLFLISLTGEGFSLPSGGELLGCAVVLLGTFCWTAHILIIDRKVGDIYPLRFSFVQFMVCAILNLICSPIFESGVLTLANIKAVLPSILFCGLMSVGIAYTCQTLGQKDANPTAAAIILSSECVFSAIGSIIIKGEFLPYAYNYVGAALIFLGIILSQLFGAGERETKGKRKTADNV